MSDPLNGWQLESAFFGEPWPSDVCETGRRTQVPAGENCFLCGTVILVGHQGTWVGAQSRVLHSPVHRPAHRECMARQLVGSIEHLTGRCQCEPPQGLSGAGSPPMGTYRENALLVWAFLEEHRFVVPSQVGRAH